jgi:hypothetical protein
MKKEDIPNKLFHNYIGHSNKSIEVILRQNIPFVYPNLDSNHLIHREVESWVF